MLLNITYIKSVQALYNRPVHVAGSDEERPDAPTELTYSNLTLLPNGKVSALLSWHPPSTDSRFVIDKFKVGPSLSLLHYTKLTYVVGCISDAVTSVVVRTHGELNRSTPICAESFVNDASQNVP